MSPDWTSQVAGLASLPPKAQQRLVTHATSLADHLPASGDECFRVVHEVLSDITDGVLLLTSTGWDADAAVDRALADFGDLPAARAALAPLVEHATYRRRSTVAASVVAAFGFWWLALFVFGGTEPWREAREPLIPSLSDGLASTALVIALAATVVARIVILLQRHVEPGRTSRWLRTACLVEAVFSGLSMSGLAVYTAYRYEAAPRSIDDASLLLALVLGCAVVVLVRSDATLGRYSASLPGRGIKPE